MIIITKSPKKRKVGRRRLTMMILLAKILSSASLSGSKGWKPARRMYRTIPSDQTSDLKSQGCVQYRKRRGGGEEDKTCILLTQLVGAKRTVISYMLIEYFRS